MGRFSTQANTHPMKWNEDTAEDHRHKPYVKATLRALIFCMVNTGIKMTVEGKLGN